MNLAGPQALLAELSRLEDLRDPMFSDGKRQFRRFVVRGEAELIDADARGIDREAVSVVLRDVSRGGVGFVSHKRLEINSVWRACFLRHHYVVAQQTLIVRYCAEVEKGVYLVGSQFCADSGLLALLGVEPGLIREGDGPVQPNEQQPLFLAPGEVA